MQAEIAPNSDSTMRYSHDSSSPVRTRSDSASTMWVCGEMGYAATTWGRHRATTCATACDPSSWLSMGVPLPGGGHVSEGRCCDGHVLLGDLVTEPLTDRVLHG